MNPAPRIRELSITSYFSLPTDLAAEMNEWPEFVSGQEYSVRLRDGNTGESVVVELFQDELNRPYVGILGTGVGFLFDKVAGRVIHALSAHSDTLMVDRFIEDVEEKVREISFLSGPDK